MRFKRRSSREIEDDEDSLSENLAEVTERLDDLTRQLAKVSRASAKRPARRDDDEQDEDDETESFRLRPSRDSRAARTDRYERSERAERPAKSERNERPEPEDRTSDRVAEAIARLDRRLDEVIAEGRNAAAASRAPAYLPHLAAPAQPVPPPAYAAAMMPPLAPAPVPAPVPAPPMAAAGPNQWAMEISARQRALDEDLAPPPAHAPAVSHTAAQPHHHAHPAAMPAANGHAHPAAHAHAAHPAPPARAAMPDLSGLENHLRDITSQIASLQRPYEDALVALRGDLAEIGRALTDALPRRAMEGLEHEIRSLSERVDRIRHTGGGVDGSMLAGLEQGLAEVRDALRHLTPAESLVGVDEAVRGLSRKIDQISMSQQDPGAFQQIEHAISSLRNVVSNVASDGALAQLAAEVRGLAANFERVAAASGPDQFAALDRRISSLVENGRQVPPQLEATIRSLTEQLERSQLSQGDQFALRSLEDRIVRLFEKLDASDARLGSLAAIERGIGDLLVAVGDLRAPRPAPAPAPAPVSMSAPESALHLPQAAQLPPAPPAPRPAPQQAAPQPAMPVAEPRPYQPVAVAPPPAAPRPAPARAPQPAAPARPEPRRPIDPHLPPDTPLEPGMGAPRLKPGSPAARIAASEAALGSARPAPAEPISKSAAIAAARNAARALAEEAPPEPKKSRFSFKRSAAKAAPAPKPRSESRPAPEPEPEPLLLLPADMVMTDETGPSTKAKLLKHGKTLLIATSVVIIVLGVLQTAMDFLGSPTTQPVASQSEPTRSDADTPTREAPASRPATPARSMPTPDSPLPTQSEPDPEPTGQIGNRAAFFDPRSVLNHMPKSADATHSIGNTAGQTRVASAQPGAQNPAVASLPASVGPVLRAALSNNDPAAEYEMGLRYAEGRGVTQSADEARRWLERSARAGFAPAQFRLASQNEKGDGVKKDVQAARQLYTAAAEKGHAKAMHNLAVLYAEGVDGKPDYRTAAQWFQRAAGHGVADSQYNLAILYARGIGVTQNLSESYKWFALAANAGDQDAGRKRDDVAARLDKSSLAAARQAVQTFTPAAEPEEATSLRTPPGGWDRNSVAAQPTKPRTRPATSGR